MSQESENKESTPPEPPPQEGNGPLGDGPLKSEDEMSEGKNYPHKQGEAVFEFDPARRHPSEEGGEPH